MATLAQFERIEQIAQAIEVRFGKTDMSLDGNDASIYFRAHKPDGLGRHPAILVLSFTYRAGDWWLINTDLSVPVWECLRGCGVENY